MHIYTPADDYSPYSEYNVTKRNGVPLQLLKYMIMPFYKRKVYDYAPISIINLLWEVPSMDKPMKKLVLQQ